LPNDVLDGQCCSGISRAPQGRSRAVRPLCRAKRGRCARGAYWARGACLLWPA